MKKLLISAIVFACAAMTAGAKNIDVTLDFANGNPLVAAPAQGENPEKPSLKAPRTGIELPTQSFKTELEAAKAAGYVEKNKEADGTVKIGYYFPYSAYNFECEGKTYSIVLGSGAYSGRPSELYYSAKSKYLRASKPGISIPSIKGYVCCGVKVSIVASKKGGEKYVFAVIRNANKKDIVAQTNPALEGVTLLETAIEGAGASDMLALYSNSSFRITKIVFSYKSL